MKTIQLFTALGSLDLDSTEIGVHPIIVNGGRKQILSIEEFLLWTNLKARILHGHEIQTYYDEAHVKAGLQLSKDGFSHLSHLIQKDLVMKSEGQTGFDALYHLFCDLVPVPEPYTPVSVTDSGQNGIRSMYLDKHLPLTTAEIIQCFEKDIFVLKDKNEIPQQLYDEYMTADNIAFQVKHVKQCKPVILMIANLYLNRKITLERR